MSVLKYICRLLRINSELHQLSKGVTFAESTAAVDQMGGFDKGTGRHYVLCPNRATGEGEKRR